MLNPTRPADEPMSPGAAAYVARLREEFAAFDAIARRVEDSTRDDRWIEHAAHLWTVAAPHGAEVARDYVDAHLWRTEERSADLFDLHVSVTGSGSGSPVAWSRAHLEREHRRYLARVRKAEERARVRERGERFRARNSDTRKENSTA